MDTAVAAPPLDRASGLLVQARALVGELASVGFSAPDGPQAGLDLLREVEVLARQVRAVQLAVLDAVDGAGVWRVDGHRSVRQMVGHACRLSAAEDFQRARCASALRDLPCVAEALREGRIGSCQVERIARTWANPRVRDAFIGLDEMVAAHAARVPYAELDQLLTNWEAMADEDGAADRAAANHRNRDVRLGQDGSGGWRAVLSCGSIDGAQLHAILTAFTDAELAADWDACRAEHGELATHALLGRTDAQRRFDALARIFALAADAHAASPGGSTITTDIVIDDETFERHLCRLASQTLPPRTLDLHGNPIPPATGDDETPEPETAERTDEVVDLDDVEAAMIWRDEHHAAERGHAGKRFHAHTLDGRFVDPTEAVANALVTHVRRAVVNARGVTIDLGRRQRLFTGNASLAAKLQATTCYWPGCSTPTSRSDIDHLDPWGRGGPTDQANGRPICGHHNRHRDRHGYTVHRRPDGTLTIHRPDGTALE